MARPPSPGRESARPLGLRPWVEGTPSHSAYYGYIVKRSKKMHSDGHRFLFAWSPRT